MTCRLNFAYIPMGKSKLNLMMVNFALVVLMCASLAHVSVAQECGTQKGGAKCANGLCCSQYGYCGSTDAYCGSGCQSNCASTSGGGSGVGAIVTQAVFEKLWPNRNSFYTYSSFINAAKSYPKFGTEGTHAQKLREIVAFAAHVQQETAGLYYITEISHSNAYCDSSKTQFPCASGEKYYGRGPLQISWNYNYGAASSSVGYNILANPDQVAKDPTLAFKTALWFWTTPSGSIPSIHNVLVGKWTPSAKDQSAGRTVGFGVTIDIINGNECGKSTSSASDRVAYFKQFASTLGVSPGQNLDCANMKPFT